MFIYTFFFLILTLALLLLSNDLTKVIITMTNIILGVTPLIGMLFGVMYFYSSREFIELLLSQPVSRRSVFSGVYMGLALSLSLSVLLGVGVPMIIFGVLTSSVLSNFLTLLLLSAVLSIIFSLMAFVLALKNDDKVKGFGKAIFLWMFFALIYDGVFLLLLMIFKDYPLEKLTISLSLLNPIGLARTLMILKLDVSAMMGYSGAVLQRFLGSGTGAILIISCLGLWLTLPLWRLLSLSAKKDF